MHLEVAGTRYYPAAAVLTASGISRQTLWRWRRESRIPCGHRFRNGQLLFTEEEYLQILEYANRVEPDERVGSRGAERQQSAGGLNG
jgi:predicted site-specific integrase-resolvase